MKKAMQKWLKRHQMTFSVDTANSLCNRFGLDTEKMDGCYMLVADLEADRITHEEFTAGLSVLTGKEPEEVMGILKGIKAVPDRKIVAVIGNKGELDKGLIKAIADKELAIACYNALANHGIAVHYTILGKMVRRYYKPEITDQQVLSCLSRYKDLFRRLEDYPGSYFLAGKKEGQTYPEIGEVSDPKKD